MLSTLIYRSRLNQQVNAAQLEQLVSTAQRNNKKIQVTGILLFDGTWFFQILEGPFHAVNALYENICQDQRHDNIVEMMRDYAPKRRFGNLGMELFDLRHHPQDSLLAAILAKGTAKYHLTYDDRVLKYIRTFVEGHWKEQLWTSASAHEWQFIPETAPFLAPDPALFNSQPCQFALQPIVDPLRRRISSLEALIRSADGGAPADYFSSIAKEKIYEADLYAKSWALALANKIGRGNHVISINLLPMSLVMVPNAVDILLEQIARHHLVPEQVIVEVTEDEVISRFDEFDSATRQLRSAGINLAIDDFGSGFAGLSLLAKFQPDKIKIDRSIITDVHKNAAKQAIVQAMVKCCSSLEIAVVAEGIEKAEEWCWLQAAGIRLFQGFLFARPKLNGVSSIAWPQKIASQP
ncbi:diguanylate phosphodiesterase [[Erwinia] mediterraneensis]|uniref:diguanylate phosphodiesterase n=1 Tax=[Erwinia] mediterraneensis TaxID=2161819 RepID=UPI001030A76F|nr:diguanylate phosphodiesterase [[Erwinia] mediterraneensis]